MAPRTYAVTPVQHQVVNIATIFAEEDFRLDARYWQEGFRAAKSRVYDSGYEVRPLGGEHGFARVWFPSRFKRVYAPNPAYGTPFLRAHATFYTTPESDRVLSAPQTRGFETYLVERGWLLLACSGTLGAVTYVTDHLAQFAVTHDLVRIVPASNEDGLYLAAYLQTDVGQTLVTHNEHGSAVPHISDKQAARIPVAVIDAGPRSRVVALMRASIEARERYTATLKNLRNDFLDVCELPPYSTFNPEYLREGVRGWGMSRDDLTSNRMDAEFFSPAHRLSRELVTKSGHGAQVGRVADLLLPGRYKRYYVEPEFGTPILGGRHIHQWRAIGIRHISDRSFSDASTYTLTEGMLVFAADGRATEKLGEPAYVTSMWDGWKGSNHLMRVIPHPDTNPGLLYLALASPYAQVQLRSSATGSVVDALTTEIVRDVIIPMPNGRHATAIGDGCISAFEGLASARRMEDEAIQILASSLEAA